MFRNFAMSGLVHIYHPPPPGKRCPPQVHRQAAGRQEEGGGVHLNQDVSRGGGDGRQEPRLRHADQDPGPGGGHLPPGAGGDSDQGQAAANGAVAAPGTAAAGKSAAPRADCVPPVGRPALGLGMVVWGGGGGNRPLTSAACPAMVGMASQTSGSLSFCTRIWNVVVVWVGGGGGITEQSGA